MPAAVLLLVVGILLLLIRILHLASKAGPPQLYYKDTANNCRVIKLCPKLSEKYEPFHTKLPQPQLELWIVIIISSAFQLHSSIVVGQERTCADHHLWQNGSHQFTFPSRQEALRHHARWCHLHLWCLRTHLWTPKWTYASNSLLPMQYSAINTSHVLWMFNFTEDLSLLICPGIANSSESLYICTCVHFAQEQGFRVAVLNHLGALKDVPLTAPRIFTYGQSISSLSTECY